MTSKKRPTKNEAPAVEETGFNGFKTDHERMSAQRDAAAAEVAEMRKVNELIRSAISSRQAPEDALEAAGYSPVKIVELMEPKEGSDGRHYAGYPLSEITAKERFLKVIDKMLPKLAQGNGHAVRALAPNGNQSHGDRVQGERQQGGENQIGG